MKKLGLFLLFITVFDTTCMEAPEAAKSQEITITSSDAQEFKVPKEVAERSETIKNMLSETGGNQVSLNYPASTIQAFVAVAKKENALAGSKKDKALLDDLAQILPTEQNQLINIVSAANYLDYQMLLDVAARKLARNLPTDWYDNIVNDLHPRIAKYHYLITGRNLNEVDENSYGFSIRELMDYNRLKRNIEASESVAKSLNLSKMRIQDLYGLNGIPNITTVQELILANNQISTLKPDVFKQLIHLVILDVSNNKLSDFQEIISSGLTAIKTLILSGNPLQRVQPTMIRKLSTLKKLHLPKAQFTKEERTRLKQEPAPWVQVFFDE